MMGTRPAPAGDATDVARPQFTIVTPSFRNSRWLKLCIASVADQEGVTFEHIVQDACSDDETKDWLPHDRRVKAFIEKDTGMYDAVNRGWKKGNGEIVAYLNCDEQYLPGALKAVYDFFSRHQEIEVVIADNVIIDVDGNYVCHRKSLVPLKSHLWFRFPALTCSIFLRRTTLERNNFYFDTRWRDLGDWFWFMDMLRAKVPMAVLRYFTAAFTETGENMNLKPNAIREKAIKNSMIPKWLKTISPLIILHHRLRLLFGGFYFQRPFDYSIYTLSSPDQRVMFKVEKPTSVWRQGIEAVPPASPAPPSQPAM
jgi:glycosyltransferase involved in cell wall biosynthesis